MKTALALRSLPIHFDTVPGWGQNRSVIFFQYGTVHQQKQKICCYLILNTATFLYRPCSDALLQLKVL